MPSLKKKPPLKFKNLPRINHSFLWPLIVLTLIMWFVYRALFSFGVLFDESIGKAIFFGFPVWLYISTSGFNAIANSFSFTKMHRGMLLGIAYGGIYGFAAAIAAFAIGGKGVVAADLFSSNNFWWEFFLSLLTAFWETLFFYSFIMASLMDKYKKWSFSKQIIITALIFMIFHLPNTILRFDLGLILPQILLMLTFGLGQALLFSKERNAYTLVLSHAIWGMVLLIYWS